MEPQANAAMLRNGNAATERDAGPLELKVLSGRHAGAVMPLAPGSYSLGQDEECDFIFLDDAFLGGKVILDVTEAIPKVSATGAVRARLADAVPAEAALDATPRALDPYRAVEVGATRFALGYAGRPWPQPAVPGLQAATADEPATADAAPVSEPPPRIAPPPRSRRLILFAAAGVCLLIVLSWLLWRGFRHPTDPALALRGILSELRLDEAQVYPAGEGFLIRGFLATESQRESLLTRMKGFPRPVRTRLVTGEEIRASIQGVLDLYRMDLPAEIGPMGKALVTGVCDNARLIGEIGEALRQGVPSEVRVESRFFPSDSVFPFVNRLLAAKVLDHKVHLEVDRGRLAGVLVRNRMDSAEMAAWNGIRSAFRSRFGMDLQEKWTDRLSPVLLRFAQTARMLDADLVGVTVGEMGYLAFRNRRKYFEGARLPGGATVKSIRTDRIVLSLGGAEQNYFLKKGPR